MTKNIQLKKENVSAKMTFIFFGRVVEKMGLLKMKNFGLLKL